MAINTINGITINKITKALYDANVLSGDITQTMIDEQVWIFTDNACVSASDLTKLAGIETGAEVNIIEGVTVNGNNVTPNNKIVNIVVPTATSGLINDSGFITNTVNNLSNYYTKTEINTLISSGLSMQVVQSLPTTNISATTIYLVLKTSGITGNVYNEYIYTNNTWELIGDTAVDLTNYALTTDIPIYLSDLDNDLDLSAYDNVIEGIKVNGTVVNPVNKVVDITLPACEDGAECNTIEIIKVNGTALTVDANKAVDIVVPAAVTRVWS